VSSAIHLLISIFISFVVDLI